MLKENDGLLVKHISRVRKISYAKAFNLVEDEVKSFKTKLYKDLLVEVKSLGIFELKNENNIHFNPDFSIHFDTSSFWLPSF